MAPATDPAGPATTEVDLLVVGSGVAGLTAAARAAAAEPGLRVAIVSKGRLVESATRWAQGGVAAVLHEREAAADAGDSAALHVEDTMRAGAGLGDRTAVEVMVTEGPARVRELAALGARFDRDRAGRWLLSREGGHSAARVVHAGGAATGAEVERALVEAARTGGALILEHRQARDLIVEGGRCRGVVTAEGPLRARHTLLATGGAGQLYPVTTNPLQATGDGVAMALRAGVAVADVEFIQFHPTALYLPDRAGPRPLLSEALRGEGAVLRDEHGARFVDELQPRDVVAAAIAARGHAWLDVSPVEDFEARFPTLACFAREAGLRPPTDWLPVAPAAHYLCGGVLTDLDGATTLPGLWAAGEVACTGVHGANRLASNSLLEGMVFAARAVEAILRDKGAPDATGALQPLLAPSWSVTGTVALRRLPARTARVAAAAGSPPDAAGVVGDLQRAMLEGAGVLRSEDSLRVAATRLDELGRRGVPEGEAANLWTVAGAVLAAAAARTESRGGHRRSDFPATEPSLSLRFVQ